MNETNASSKSTFSKTMSWCFYDWANSAFAVSILSGLFPIFFKEHWAKALTKDESTFWLGIANSLISALIFIFSPMLGQLANTTARKIKLLKVVTALGALFSIGFYFVEANQYLWALVMFGFSYLCFALSHLFYDALLPEFSKSEDEYHKNSMLGYGLGYLGGGLLFLLQTLFIRNSDSFGLTTTMAVYLSFVSTGIWWLLFSFPLLLSKPIQYFSDVTEEINFKVFYKNFISLFKNKNPIGLFLISYFFYIDGLQTVYKMAVDFGLALGFPSSTMMITLLVVQFVGLPSAFLFIYLSNKISIRPILLSGIAAYFIVILIASQIQTGMQFILCGALVGVFQGCVQALSRSYFCLLIPDKNQSGTYFGMYNMIGRFSALFGPLTTAIVVKATGSHRLAILSLSIYLILGLVTFPKIKAKNP
jgi:MFS transporter, UMF1 family